MLRGKVKQITKYDRPAITGIFHFEPVVGESFFIGDIYRTEKVTEIVDEHTFLCGNFTYEWSITNADF